MEKEWKKERSCCICEAIRGWGYGRVRLYGCKFCGHAVCASCSPVKLFHTTTQKVERTCSQCLEDQEGDEAAHLAVEEKTNEILTLRMEIREEQEARKQAEMEHLMALEDFNQMRIRFMEQILEKDRLISQVIHVPGFTQGVQTSVNTQDQCVSAHPCIQIGIVQTCQDSVQVAETQVTETSVSTAETQVPEVVYITKTVQTDNSPTLDIASVISILIPSVPMTETGCQQECFRQDSATQIDPDFSRSFPDIEGMNTSKMQFSWSSNQVDVFPSLANGELTGVIVRTITIDTLEKETETDFCALSEISESVQVAVQMDDIEVQTRLVLQETGVGTQCLELHMESSGMSVIPAVSPCVRIEKNEQICEGQMTSEERTEPIFPMNIEHTASLSIVPASSNQIPPFHSIETGLPNPVLKPVSPYKKTPKPLVLCSKDPSLDSPFQIRASESTEISLSPTSKSDVSWRNKDGKFSPGIEGTEKESQTDVTEKDVTAAMEDMDTQITRIEALEKEVEEYQRIIKYMKEQKTGKSEVPNPNPKGTFGRLTMDEEERISLQFGDNELIQTLLTRLKESERELHHVKKPINSFSRSAHSTKISQRDVARSACKCHVF